MYDRAIALAKKKAKKERFNTLANAKYDRSIALAKAKYESNPAVAEAWRASVRALLARDSIRIFGNANSYPDGGDHWRDWD